LYRFTQNIPRTEFLLEELKLVIKEENISNLRRTVCAGGDTYRVSEEAVRESRICIIHNESDMLNNCIHVKEYEALKFFWICRLLIDPLRALLAWIAFLLDEDRRRGIRTARTVLATSVKTKSYNCTNVSNNSIRR
jgi:hypothetical protein